MGEYKHRRSTRPTNPIPRSSASASASTSAAHTSQGTSIISVRPDTTRISSLLQSTTLAPPGPHFLRRNGVTLHALRSVQSSEFVVLFTPAIPPPTLSASPKPRSDSPTEAQPHPSQYAHGRRIIGLPMDPFEPLGRALCRSHKRVRHVPFVPGSPGAGVGEIHATFLESAGGVVLVLCEARNSSPRSSPERNLPGVDTAVVRQAAFAQEIFRRSHSSAGDTPLVLVVVSAGRDRSEELLGWCGLDRFETVVHADSFEAAALNGIAETIFCG